ncbi:MAG: DUF4153 domain-containing protein [Firmicutes bacterium HGW-Firmicutes-4]|jgi:MFS family permease|nr:MAG: DUF4153 domain-containing protein [Firmicutes bacterium HGW-Firmicutes-4]
MKFIDKIREKLSGLVEALMRYPLTVVFLVAAALVNTVAIHQDVDYTKYFLTFLVGAFLGFALQAAWERFSDMTSHRIAAMALGLVLTLGYFLIVRQYTSTSMETWIRTAVALFALLIAYIWVPVIKSEISFNQSFMAAFKAFFNSLLFSGVLFIGITLIITAIDLLLFRVSEKSYLDTLNIVGMLFAPIYFLSLIPLYPGRLDKSRTTDQLDNNREKVKQSCLSPKFLEILVAYIVIPLLTVYTVIMIIYIARNITGEFWTDNRLEPMLVSFASAVILIYILASNLENRFAELFRKIFPKVLVPIVLFQIVASVLRIQETGMTHGRYFVIVFGIFAAVSGVLMSFMPVRKNGIIAALIIGFSLFSIIPPLDAFTISRTNQTGRLTETLVANKMLENNMINPNASVAEADKKIISDSVNYLAMMEYTKEISYLGEDFNVYEDFYDTFGFYRYEENQYRQDSIYLNLDQQSPLDISDYETFVVANFYGDGQKLDSKIAEFDKNGKTYTLSNDKTAVPGMLILSDETGSELMRIDMKKVFDHFDTSPGGDYQISKDSMSADEATFTQENDQAVISLVAMFLAIEKSGSEPIYNGDFYVLVHLK